MKARNSAAENLINSLDPLEYCSSTYPHTLR